MASLAVRTELASPQMPSKTCRRRAGLHATEHLGAVVHVHRGNHHGERLGHDRRRDAADDGVMDPDGALDADSLEECRHDDSLLELLVRKVRAGERREVQVQVVDAGALLARHGVGHGDGPFSDTGQPGVEVGVVGRVALEQGGSVFFEHGKDVRVLVAGMVGEKLDEVDGHEQTALHGPCRSPGSVLPALVVTANSSARMPLWMSR